MRWALAKGTSQDQDASTVISAMQSSSIISSVQSSSIILAYVLYVFYKSLWCNGYLFLIHTHSLQSCSSAYGKTVVVMCFQSYVQQNPGILKHQLLVRSSDWLKSFDMINSVIIGLNQAKKMVLGWCWAPAACYHELQDQQWSSALCKIESHLCFNSYSCDHWVS